MNKPRLTARALNGLYEAVNRMYDDDSCLDDHEQRTLDAARKWIEDMNQWRAEKAEKRTTK